jgi:hypothetical protein
MFTFRRAILLMSVRERDKVINTNTFKEGTQLVVLTPPTPNPFAWLESSNQRGVQHEPENHGTFENFVFMFEKINPIELTKIIKKDT